MRENVCEDALLKGLQGLGPHALVPAAVKHESCIVDFQDAAHCPRTPCFGSVQRLQHHLDLLGHSGLPRAGGPRPLGLQVWLERR